MSLSQGMQLVEEVASAGASPAQLVRQHELEVFARSFPGWVSAFAATYCLVAPLAFGLFVWLIVCFILEREKPCDVPLGTWAIVVFASTGYDMVHFAVLRYICRFDPTSSSRLQIVARGYVVLVSLLDLAWQFVGVFWVATSKTCEETAPNLFTSVKVNAASAIVFGIFLGVNAVGLFAIMNWMLLNGMLSTRDAAPPGTLETLPVVEFRPGSPDFEESPDCCICLAAFDAAAEIRRAPQCGHVFHSRCLGNWLKVSRTCPLCRRDLAPVASPPEAGGGLSINGLLHRIVGRPAGA